jgi:hypothetical protein
MNKLISYLKAHGVEVIESTDTTISVNSVFCKDGVASTEVEVINADVASVREYLGY